MCSRAYCTCARWITTDDWYPATAANVYSTASSSITVTNAGTMDTTWAQWNTNSITVTNATYDPQLIWGTWVTANGRSRRVQREEWVEAATPSPEDLAAAVERQAAEARRLDDLRQRNREANERAEALLESCLTTQQLDDLDTIDAFRVTAASGRQYVIHRGYAGNVESEGFRYCIHGPSDLPHADQMLMQKLLLETDEAAFLRIANATPVVRRVAA